MNTDLAYARLGPCEEFELDIVEWIDGVLAGERAGAVRRHLDGCARCRSFERSMRAVDDSLSSALPRAQLSADFDARLHARIAKLSRASSPDSARARAEQEYRGAVAALRRGLAWRTALNAVATATVVGSLALGIMTTLPFVSHALGLGLPLEQTWTLGVGAIALAGGLLAARGARHGAPSLFA
jgi:anti-sigma factor RsiW